MSTWNGHLHRLFNLLLTGSPPPSPRSAPFPYTTLFRSHHLGAVGAVVQREREDAAEQRVQLPPQQGKHIEQPEQDRKSTRLNSSHVAISYAVFCLKKKRTLN